MEKLQLREFLNYKFISSLEMSPDKNNAGFVVSAADYDSNNYKSNIWLMNTHTKKYSKLTSLNKEKSFLWLDNETLLFASLRDDKLKGRLESGEAWTIYYTIGINGGEAEEFMRIPLNVTDIKPIDLENFIITAQFDNNIIDLHGLTGEEREKAAEKIKENRDYEVLDEIPFWINGGGFTNKKRNRLYIFNKTAGKLTPITDEFTNVNVFKYKDNSILYVSNRFTDKTELYNSLNIYNINENKNTVLIHQEKYSIGYADFIGDKVILTLSDMKKLGANQNKDIYRFEKGELKLITAHDTGFGNSVSSDCKYGGGKDIRIVDEIMYFISTIGKSSFINKLSLNGDLEVLSEDIGSIECFDINNEEILFIGQRGSRLQEIYGLSNKTETQLTTLNEDIYINRSISIPEYMPFYNNDGIELDGFVIKPTDYDENKKYPAILDIHGGPKAVFGEVFFHEMQVWANMGYFVFFCNPRGGDGKGNEFSDIRGKYGTIDYDDLMKFTDLVLKHYPQIDDKRVGVTGGSYGGFMTNWIIGHTDRFRCAASQRSISNWISKFGTTDIGYFFCNDQNLATPWQNHDKLWWHSPLKYADKVVTPTLFINSDEDYRCWIPEGLQMFTALKYHGVEARLCMFKGENHELSRSGKPKHRVRRLEEITNWFEKYLK